MAHTERGSEMLAQCLNAIALGRMMAAGEIDRIALMREMYRLLRYFAAEINIRTCRYRITERILRRTGAPANATQGFAAITDNQRRATQHALD